MQSSVDSAPKVDGAINRVSREGSLAAHGEEDDATMDVATAVPVWRYHDKGDGGGP